MMMLVVALFLGCEGRDQVSFGSKAALDARTIRQFVEPLVVPPAMPPMSTSGSAVEYRSDPTNRTKALPKHCHPPMRRPRAA